MAFPFLFVSIRFASLPIMAHGHRGCQPPPDISMGGKERARIGTVSNAVSDSTAGDAQARREEKESGNESRKPEKDENSK
jgi:hypothetical protein